MFVVVMDKTSRVIEKVVSDRCQEVIDPSAGCSVILQTCSRKNCLGVVSLYTVPLPCRKDGLSPNVFADWLYPTDRLSHAHFKTDQSHSPGQITTHLPKHPHQPGKPPTHLNLLGISAKKLLKTKPSHV